MRRASAAHFALGRLDVLSLSFRLPALCDGREHSRGAGPRRSPLGIFRVLKRKRPLLFPALVDLLAVDTPHVVAPELDASLKLVRSKPLDLIADRSVRPSAVGIGRRIGKQPADIVEGDRGPARLLTEPQYDIDPRSQGGRIDAVGRRSRNGL